MPATSNTPKPRQYIVKSISVHRKDLPALLRAARMDRRSLSSYLVNCGLQELRTRELDKAS